jgi:hypothetical protein
MARTKISEFSATAASNTDIDSINIAEGCAPSGINDAIRELMSQLKDFQTGAVGDSFNGPVNGTLGATTPATASVTTLAASGAVTLSGGTANGVTYLNGSKVLTSGSALTFDGSALSVTGTITAAGQLATILSTNSALQIATSNSNAGALADNNVIAGNGTNNAIMAMKGTGFTTSGIFSANNAYFGGTGTSSTNLYSTTGNINIYPAATLAATFTTTGLGIGTSSPAVALEVLRTGNAYGVFRGGSATNAQGVLVGQNSAGDGLLYNGFSAGSLLFSTNATERARIDTSGKLLVNLTSVIPTENGQFQVAGSTNTAMGLKAGSNNYAASIYNSSNTFVGSITVTSSATAYNTSSDYRLKNTIAPMTGALNKVAQLKPVTYKWNVDDSDGEGFIAHELAEVCPNAVTGEKDAVDAEGNPQYQGIDVSFLVATLTAAIQEQQALIQSLTARLDAANL